jgi:glycosyltransferase involved in cell wall biosynthesis
VQIIVVDDNSDSDKVDFANFPGINDPYVEVIFGKNENGRKGAGYARNLGLERAKGKWLVFADADDFFTENAFDILHNNIDSEHEIIYYKVTSCYSDSYENADRNKEVNTLIDKFVHKEKNAEDNIRYRHLPPWGKMVQLKLIQRESVRFEEVIAANDRVFSITSGHSAHSVSAVNQTVYCITVNKGSIAHTVSIDNLKSKYVTTLRCNEFVKRVGKTHCQYSFLPDLYLSTQLGLSTFREFLSLAIYYRANPFIGFSRIFRSGYNFFKERIKNKKYIVYQ